MSVMSTNPAGIGLFRSSDVSLTGGIVRHADASSFAGRNAAVASFDQAGFVYAIPVGGKTVRFSTWDLIITKRRISMPCSAVDFRDWTIWEFIVESRSRGRWPILLT